MTGVDDPYEEPESPDLTIGVDGREPVDLAVEVVELVVGAGR
jgi:adenylylsulfate kinase-like enzyme